jgi:membrane dipeptidase
MAVLPESKLPLFVTHANAKSLCQHVRNLDDDYYQTVKERRGVVGFVFANGMIGGTRNREELVRHMLYVYEKFGPEVMAIGSDFFGLGSLAPQGLEDVTKVKELWNDLLDKGLKESDIEKISYKNALRVVQANARMWKPFA